MAGGVEKLDQLQLEEPLMVNEKVKTFPQYVAAISVSLFLLVSGTVLGWSSPTIPILKSENSTIPVTDDQLTWITSAVPLGAIVGPFPAGIAADYIGRKKTMLASAVMLLASWGLLAAAASWIYLVIGRIIAGFACGWGMTAMPMYIAEIATANVRGALGVLGQIQICTGFLLVYSIGPFVPYLWLCILCGILPVVFFCFFAMEPETPYFLILKNDVKGATKSLQKLRGQTEKGVKKELNILQVDVENALRNTGTWKDTLTIQANRKAVLIIFGLMALQQLSGINVVLFYSQTIFDKAGSSLSPSICTILIAIVMTLASFIVPYFIEKGGRRLTMLVSAVGMAISLLCLGIYFYIDTYKTVDTSKLGWFPLTAIVAYIIAYSFGAGPVPWMMISEVFASNIRSKGSALSSSSSWLMAFFMTNLYSTVEGLIGAHGAFWFFAASCVIGAILVFLFLPETKGKSLREIQDMLSKK